jgi:predicted phosphodiesterase
MRIAAISDIHANYPALLAVLKDIKRQGDELLLVVAGDFLNCGPFPKETVNLLRRLNPIIIQGNHDEWVLGAWKGIPSSVPWIINAPARWTASQLSQDDLEWLEKVPHRAELNGPDGSRVVVLHASPLNNMQGIFQEMSEEVVALRFAGEKIRPKTLYLLGHVHHPVLRRWQGATLAGDGSVGQPHDHDTRACYLIAEWDTQNQEWQVEHHRVEYDRTGIIEAMKRHSAYDEGGPVMKLITESFIRGYGIGYPQFLRDYIRNSDWAGSPNPMQHLDEAVDRYLEEIKEKGVPPFVLLA